MLHSPADGPKAILCQVPKQETPHIHGVFLVLESGNVLLSRAFPIALFPPLAARDGKPNQVQCCTRLKMAREENSRIPKKKPSHKAELFLWNPATSYSPGRFQPCCFAHRARTAGNLAKYNACTCPQTARKQYSVRFQNKKHPIFMGCFLFWNPATSYSPGPSPAKYHRR